MTLKEIKTFWDNGNIWEHYFVDENDLIQGIDTWYWRNGVLAYEIMIRDDLIHGEEIYYDSYGQITVHKVYVDDVFHANYEDLTEIDRFELSLKYGIEWIV